MDTFFARYTIYSMCLCIGQSCFIDCALLWEALSLRLRTVLYSIKILPFKVVSCYLSAEQEELYYMIYIVYIDQRKMREFFKMKHLEIGFQFWFHFNKICSECFTLWNPISEYFGIFLIDVKIQWILFACIVSKYYYSSRAITITTFIEIWKISYV